MVWGLFLFSLIASVAQSTLMNEFSKRRMQSSCDLYLYNLITCAVAAVAMLLYGGIPQVSLFTLLLGVAFGLATNLGAVFKLLALRSGAMCYTLLIITAQMMIPALSGALVWDEPLSALKILGALLMFVSVALSIEYKAEKKATLRWFLYCVAALLCSGSVGVMQKVLGYSDYSQEQNGFLLVAMLVSALFALGSFLYRRYGKGEVPTLKLLSAATPAAAINGVCMVVCNVVNLYLAAVMPSILFFPLFNGGALLLLTAVAFLVFRERLNRVQTVGFLIGVAAVFLLCLG